MATAALPKPRPIIIPPGGGPPGIPPGGGPPGIPPGGEPGPEPPSAATSAPPVSFFKTLGDRLTSFRFAIRWLVLAISRA
ncbi:MAG: hypothetical protein DWI06_02865 [Planctomycetota bacterium]|nr:MAG: hypothetical protein DWI06_02865 [Planctomycetota bacterium]